MKPTREEALDHVRKLELIDYEPGRVFQPALKLMLERIAPILRAYADQCAELDRLRSPERVRELAEKVYDAMVSNQSRKYPRSEMDVIYVALTDAMKDE